MFLVFDELSNELYNVELRYREHFQIYQSKTIDARACAIFSTVKFAMRAHVQICAYRSFFSDRFGSVPGIVAQRYIAHSKAHQKIRTSIDSTFI